MYRGAAGIDQLNTMTQALLNPLEEGELEFLHNEQAFRQGDRVIHLVNDAEANVFNGDLGYITDLLPAKYTDSKQDEITINFDGSEVTYPRNEWYNITLAYAMSIHKSQGSEFQVVILPITRTSHRMLQRNLVYTAITRPRASSSSWAKSPPSTMPPKCWHRPKNLPGPTFPREMAEQDSKEALAEKAESKTAATTQTQPPTQPDRKELVKVVKENNQQLSLLDQDQPEKQVPNPQNTF